MALKKKQVMLIIFAAGITVGISIWYGLTKQDALRCNFAKNSKLVFRLSMTSKSKLNPQSVLGGSQQPGSQSLQTSTIGYSGRLNLQLVEQEQGDYLFISRLSDSQGQYDFNSKIIPELEQDFLLTMDNQCRFKKIGLKSQDSVAAMETLHLIFQTMAFVLPENAEAESWKTIEQDAIGFFSSEYTYYNYRINRRRVSYKDVKSPAPGVRLRAEIVKSESEGVLSRDQTWLENAKVIEQVRIRNSSGDLFADVSSSLILQRVRKTTNLDLNLVNVDPKKAFWQVAGNFDHNSKRTSSFDHLSLDPSLNGVTVKQILQNLMPILSSKDPSTRIEGVRSLVKFLRQNPNAPLEILSYFKDPNQSDDVSRWIMFALEKTATKSSEEALVIALQDQEFSSMNRIRAVHALSDTKSLSDQGLETMATIARNFSSKSSDHNEVAAASVLALGVVGRNYPSNHQYNSAVRRDLEYLAQQSLGDDREEVVTTVLYGLGNTGDASYTDIAKPFLKAPSPLVRGGAGNVLARICSRECAENLVDLAAKEKETYAREAISAGFADRGVQLQESRLINKLSQLLVAETQTGIQLNLITTLGPLAKTLPAVRKTLVETFHRSMEPKIKVAIGRYVGARDIVNR